MKTNADLEVIVRKARYTNEYFDLYQRYLMTRHPDGGMSDTSPDKFRDFLIAEWCNTVFIEFRLNGRLVGVAVSDKLDQGYSAVYTFFDPVENKRSLGVFAILWQIAYAREQHALFVYLGYLIEDCDKMKYKADYRPLEVLGRGEWKDLDAYRAILSQDQQLG